jgi:hypothetical protein
MSTTRGDENIPGTDAQRANKLKTLVHRWHKALAEIRDARFSGDLRQRIDARRRDRRACDYARCGRLPPAAGDIRDPEPLGAAPSAGDGDAGDRQLVPLPSERSQALAALCDRLLQELDGTEVRAAEIRFAVRKDEHPNYPGLDDRSVADAAEGELVWELRRLIAWSDGAIADVARALESRGAELDESALELLRDEVAALDVDLATLNVHLADPVDWDGELEYLLAGEVAPFDDLVADEDDEHDD